MNPLVTALPLFCLWKPITALLPAVALLLYSANPAWKVVVAKIFRVLLLLVPSTVLPRALSKLLLAIDTAAV